MLMRTPPAATARSDNTGRQSFRVVRRHDREEDLMDALLIGYARVSTDDQDVTAQRDALTGLGVTGERIYVDHGLTGSNRDRPGLREALAACRDGDTLDVTKLDRLARSLPDAREILADLTTRHVKLSLGGSVHDPTDPVGRLLFNVLAMVAEFEADLIRLRTREGMKVAKAKGRLRGKQPNAPGSAPGRPAPRRRTQRRRTRRPLRRGPLHRIPRHPTQHATARSPGGAHSPVADRLRGAVSSVRDAPDTPRVGLFGSVGLLALWRWGVTTTSASRCRTSTRLAAS